MEGLVIRSLDVNDYYKNYLQLLSQLTVVEIRSFDEFKTQYECLNKEFIKIFVIEYDNTIIATGTLIIEKKFIRGFKSVGHIEDIVVGGEFRGKGIGKIMINHLISYGKANDCYKIILDCDEENIPFYKKCGFYPKATCMALYS